MRIIGKEYKGERSVISLTSGRVGIGKVGLCIFSLLASSPGYHIRLTIGKTYFPYMESELPPDLKLLLQARLFELVVLDRDAKSDFNLLFGIDQMYGCPVFSLDSNTIYDFDLPSELYRMYMNQYRIPESVAKKLAEPQLILSLTTWKGRINHPDFPNNLKSLLEQDTRVRFRVCLVLSIEEFGEDYVLPKAVSRILDRYDNFEVIWTYRNTKALKNYDPTARVYPELPIVVIGDDTIYDRKLVETVYRTYLNSDRRTVFGAMVAHSHEGYGILSPYRIRLFPPHCMAYLDEEYFIQYFRGHNDLFNGVRLWIAGTKVEKANWDGLWHRAFAQEVRLREYHEVPEWKMVEDFFAKVSIN